MKLNRWTMVLGLSAVSLLAGSLFQNCSKVNFAPSADLSSQGATDIDVMPPPIDAPIDVKTTEIKVGARNVPPLKLFFIVDNSFTMQQNRLNLASSFQNMFATTGGKSLSNFATTAYLINTAQKSPAWNSADINGLVALQKPASVLTTMNSSLVPAFRSATMNSGAVPGDNIGFGLTATSDSVVFSPAMVAGLKDNGSGKIQHIQAMSKAAGENPSALATEFQSRLALLSSARIPLNPDGTQQYSSIIDSESGLCAMARILRNNNGLFAPGDQTAFVIVSDEDENDPAGEACVQAYNNTTLNDELIKGRCEERSSILSYTAATMAGDSCKVTYTINYKYSYAWTQSTPKTEIKYYKMTNSGSFTQPRTAIAYQVENKSYSATTTNITYYLRTATPIIADGIKVGENVTYSQKSGSAKGDLTGNCNAAASALNSNAVLNDAGHPVACAKAVASVGSCAAGDASCVTTSSYASNSAVVDGTFANGTPCVNEAKKISGAIVDGSKPLTCAASAPRSGSGACSAAMAALGCAAASAPAYTVTPVTIAGDYSAQADCNAKAATQSSALVDATHPAVCTYAPVTENKSATGTIAFNSTVDGGATLPVGACGSLTTTIFNAVKGSNSLANASGTCSLTGYNTATQSPAVSTAGCAAQAAAICDGSSKKYRDCSGTVIAGSAGTSTVAMPSVTREVTCSELCSASSNQFCAAAAGVTVTPTMKIEDYLKARYGAGTTCSIARSASTASNFVDRKLSDKPSICAGTSAKPQYLVQDGASYRLQELVTEHVAGSNKISVGNYKPASNLVAYIDSRIASLFGASKPITSVFVRTAADGVGQGGSIGTTYQTLAGVLGGKTERVTSADYSSAFTQLGDVIQARLERSFTVAGMTAFQTVRAVEQRSAGQSNWVKLNPSLWSAAGKSVTLDPSLPLSLEDDIRFTYY